MSTNVTFVLDRSGSMRLIAGDTIGALNAYIDTLKEGDADITFSLSLFDSIDLYGELAGARIECVHTNKPIKEVEPFALEAYKPCGFTPLIDTVYKTIKEVSKATKGTDTKVVICVQTDGQENSSKKHTWEQLNALVKKKTAKGWQFNFMGAGIDAYKQARQMGLDAGQTMSYDSGDRISTVSAFSAQARNTRLYASGSLADTNYTSAQKKMSGDKFVPKSTATAKPRGAKKAPVSANADPVT
jgi:hypothetical protein